MHIPLGALCHSLPAGSTWRRAQLALYTLYQPEYSQCIIEGGLLLLLPGLDIPCQGHVSRGVAVQTSKAVQQVFDFN
jgi:hypothetical protein